MISVKGEDFSAIFLEMKQRLSNLLKQSRFYKIAFLQAFKMRLTLSNFQLLFLVD